MRASSFCRCHNHRCMTTSKALPNPEKGGTITTRETNSNGCCPSVRSGAIECNGCNALSTGESNLCSGLTASCAGVGREWDEYGTDTAAANAINRQMAAVAVKDMEMEFEKSRRMRLQLLASTYCTRRRGNPPVEFRATEDVTGMEELGNVSSRRLDQFTGSGDKEIYPHRRKNRKHEPRSTIGLHSQSTRIRPLYCTPTRLQRN